jgi:hypothetical protein
VENLLGGDRVLPSLNKEEACDKRKISMVDDEQPYQEHHIG